MKLQPIAICLLLLSILASCTASTAFKAYRDLPAEGWNARDTLTFEVDTIRCTAPYEVLLSIRTSSAHAYPFQQLTIVAEQEWLATDQAPAHCWKDTLSITITNEQGDAQGNGISCYEYLLPLNPIHLHSGQKGRIRIYHLMRRPILSGITNVGLEVTPQ